MAKPGIMILNQPQNSMSLVASGYVMYSAAEEVTCHALLGVNASHNVVFQSRY